MLTNLTVFIASTRMIHDVWYLSIVKLKTKPYYD